MQQSEKLKSVKIDNMLNWKKVKEEIFGDSLQQGLLKAPDLKQVMMS